MFGIRGLDPFGLVHALLGVAALILGLAVLLRRKGTRVHRRLGQRYVLTMVLLNATALMIYDLYGRFGPFHVASIISLATVSGGFVPVYLRRPRGAWIHLHAWFMCWSVRGSGSGVRVRSCRSGPRGRFRLRRNRRDCSRRGWWGVSYSEASATNTGNGCHGRSNRRCTCRRRWKR